VRSSPILLVCAAALAALAVPAPVMAGDGGGVAAPDEPHSDVGGGRFGTHVPAKKRRARKRRGTVLTSFEVRRRSIALYGRPARIVFTLEGRRAVRARIHVLSAANRSRVATIDLGERGAGRHSVPFSGLETGTPLPEGAYLLHIAGRRLRRGPTASSTAEVEVSHYAFPIAGSFDWGGDGSRFGAKRDGHRHQGQDLAAAEGTPVVAPRAGEIEVVQYQARGAGHYVVLDSEDEDRDYVFMHLRTGSITVEEGETVRTGQQLGEVGSTGASSGPHLHFEIWVGGGWFTGGEPIDPLPLLRSWAP